MTIEHLALDGGGPFGLITLGALRRSHGLGLWQMEDIKSIRCISSGSIVALSLLLHSDWDILYNYYVNRPWGECMACLLTKIPLCTEELCTIMLEPLITAADFTIDVTFKELHTRTKKELTIIASEISKNLEPIEFNYKTHPNMKIVKACAISCALFPFFRPVFMNKRVYLDGAFATGNYALANASKEIVERTMHLIFVWSNDTVVEEDAFLTIAPIVLGSMIAAVRFTQSGSRDPKIKIQLLGGKRSVDEWLEVVNKLEVRERYVAQGTKIVESFIGGHLVDKLGQKR